MDILGLIAFTKGQGNGNSGADWDALENENGYIANKPFGLVQSPEELEIVSDEISFQEIEIEEQKIYVTSVIQSSKLLTDYIIVTINDNEYRVEKNILAESDQGTNFYYGEYFDIYSDDIPSFTNYPFSIQGGTGINENDQIMTGFRVIQNVGADCYFKIENIIPASSSFEITEEFGEAVELAINQNSLIPAQSKDIFFINIVSSIDPASNLNVSSLNKTWREIFNAAKDGAMPVILIGSEENKFNFDIDNPNTEYNYSVSWYPIEIQYDLGSNNSYVISYREDAARTRTFFVANSPDGTLTQNEVTT